MEGKQVVPDAQSDVVTGWVPLVSAPPRLAQVAYVQVFEADRIANEPANAPRQIKVEVAARGEMRSIAQGVFLSPDQFGIDGRLRSRREQPEP